MKLQTRFLWMIGLVALALIVPTAVVVNILGQSVMDAWSVRLTELQASYDLDRTLAPIAQETRLAKALSQVPEIIDWARDPEDPTLRQKGLAQLEKARPLFRDKTYFLALAKSGEYFFNNAKNEFPDGRSHLLKADEPKDAWFFSLIKSQETFNVNIDHDLHLATTRVWINIVIRSGPEVLGVVGTGMELDGFLEQVIKSKIAGLDIIMLSPNGAVQLHRDKNNIEYASTFRPRDNSPQGLQEILDRPADVQALLAAMQAPGSMSETVPRVLRMNIQGREHLAGLVAIPSLGWFEVTLIDSESILPTPAFWMLAWIILISVLILLTVVGLLVRTQILRPLAVLQNGLDRLKSGEGMQGLSATPGKGELGQVIRNFLQTAQEVTELRHSLEAKVIERTQALQELMHTDVVTALLNRRGFEAILQQEQRHYSAQGLNIGLLTIDLDHFKHINDEHGHAVGDAALKHIANTIRQNIRATDSCARWGGDEFSVMLGSCSVDNLKVIGENLCRAVRENPLALNEHGLQLPLSVSIGGCLVPPGEALDEAFVKADKALYQSKLAGRGCFSMAT